MSVKIYVFLNIEGTVQAFISGGIPLKVVEEQHSISTLALALDEVSLYQAGPHILHELITNGANPNLAPLYQDSPLISAISKTFFEVVDILIKAGANVGHKGKDGNTAVHICCKKGKFMLIMQMRLGKTYWNRKRKYTENITRNKLIFFYLSNSAYHDQCLVFSNYFSYLWVYAFVLSVVVFFFCIVLC